LYAAGQKGWRRRAAAGASGELNGQAGQQALDVDRVEVAAHVEPQRRLGRDRAVGQDTAEGAPRPPARKKRAAPRRRRAGGRRLQQAVDDPEEQLVTWRVAEHPFLAAVELVWPSLEGWGRSVSLGNGVR